MVVMFFTLNKTLSELHSKLFTEAALLSAPCEIQCFRVSSLSKRKNPHEEKDSEERMMK